MAVHSHCLREWFVDTQTLLAGIEMRDIHKNVKSLRKQKTGVIEREGAKKNGRGL